MAEVQIEIAGRNYAVNCRDGEEEHLRAIAQLVDAKAREAQRSVGGVNEVRNLLFASLLLADELKDIRAGAATQAAEPAPPAPPPTPAAAPRAAAVAPPHALQPDLVPIIEKLAERMEMLADRLETQGVSA